MFQTIEQQLNARRIHKLGAGIDTRAQQDVPVPTLLSETAKLLSDPSFKENAKKIGESFTQTGGVGPAVDAVEEAPNFYIKEKKMSTQNREEKLMKWSRKVTEALKEKSNSSP